ncbi:glycerol-3-phosphate acyltransferase [Caldibacillus lycopersici]|uniref:Glycerol-3-phosphate acyltransferase n=1 Tax=Perspicuibacillus lycopersici TaxID=1325689 RepID=A0AAE3LRL0_9BACI|nr:glycerol-3-phosphate acyltransferase [Perspicuibacillus lycopersici]MCU9614784.1 glycerol-3-phosphate acyltransferase [Perspicuibacillus lycopersici]
MIILLTVLCFFCGSLMFSYWVGLMIHKNIRTIGDGNPGAANLWKSAGYKFGLLGVVLDFLKGYIPLFFILSATNLTNYQLIPLALAPIFGHAFSPFLKCNGGKSLAVSFGVWSALTDWRGALAYAIILALLSLLLQLMKRRKSLTSEEDGRNTVIGMLLLVLFFIYGNYPNFIFWIWFGNLLILIYKNKQSLFASTSQNS